MYWHAGEEIATVHNLWGYIDGGRRAAQPLIEKVLLKRPSIFRDIGCLAGLACLVLGGRRLGDERDSFIGWRRSQLFRRLAEIALSALLANYKVIHLLQVYSITCYAVLSLPGWYQWGWFLKEGLFSLPNDAFSPPNIDFYVLICSRKRKRERRSCPLFTLLRHPESAESGLHYEEDQKNLYSRLMSRCDHLKLFHLAHSTSVTLGCCLNIIKSSLDFLILKDLFYFSHGWSFY